MDLISNLLLEVNQRRQVSPKVVAQPHCTCIVVCHLRTCMTSYDYSDCSLQHVCHITANASCQDEIHLMNTETAQLAA